MSLQIIQSHTINFVDSAACEDLKIGSGTGESRLYMGQKNELAVLESLAQDVEFFFFTKKDLLNYMEDAKEEYMTPSQTYRHAHRFPKIYHENLKAIDSAPDYTKINFILTNDSSRCFFRIAESSRNDYDTLRRICIPKFTKLIFRKVYNTDNNKYYVNIMPVFNKKYTAAQLGAILKNAYDSEPAPKKPAIYIFGFQYAKYIKDDISVKDVIAESGLSDAYEIELTNAINIYNKCISKGIGINANADIWWGDVFDDSTGDSDCSSKKCHLANPDELQIIYFGAPGTGKSHGVKERLKTYGIIEDPESARKNCHRVFRTTFHPDSDYATFVGCYKPTSMCPSAKLLNKDELKAAAAPIMAKASPGDVIKLTCDFFEKYAESILVAESECSSRNALYKHIFGKTPTIDTYLHNFSEIIADLRKDIVSKITYKFTPQTFTDAYITAWKEWEKSDDETTEMVFLVIEEINRGNCAQIFGDLFQLLDRKRNGFSEYKIKANRDLADYLKEKLGENSGGIKNDELRLPPNFSILATMNTSDQSLFPMDSAFKRRWDWEYIPIKHDCTESDYTITIGEKKYGWLKFIASVNQEILNLSESEDKQLGNFFIKGNIGIKEFKSKVMFYLWSEVCKDYYRSGSFFKYKESEDNEVEFTFNMLFDDSKDVQKILQGFMEHLKVPELKDSTPDATVDATTTI